MFDLTLQGPPERISQRPAADLWDRLPGLPGTAVDAAGPAVTGARVIAFPADRRYWWPDSRRVKSSEIARPARSRDR